jgi:hypothetical protein
LEFVWDFEFVICDFSETERGSVSEWFAGSQGMLNPFQRLPFSTQREKGLPLQVQKVLLRNRGRMVEVSSREDVGKFFSNQEVVF